MLKTQRKRRSDRNYLIYVITNMVTGEQYIGITVKNSTVQKTLHRRVQKHVQRALAEDKQWALCESIRRYRSQAFEYGFVEQIRGRKAAYQRERELIALHNPILNTF
jgi:exopolysaccharide biosynthesis protein